MGETSERKAGGNERGFVAPGPTKKNRPINILHRFKQLCALHLFIVFLFLPLFWNVYAFTELINSIRNVRNNEVTVRNAVLTVVLCYAFYYWVKDKGAQFRGRYFSQRMRKLPFWKVVFGYFPVKIILSEELIQQSSREVVSAEQREDDPIVSDFHGLPVDRNYLVGYHPHGCFTIGEIGCFATEAAGFSRKFLGLRSWMAVNPAFFRWPIARELAISMGFIGATYNEMRYLLDPERCGEKGNFLVISVGGVSEMLETTKGQYILSLEKRYGFFKLALETGASLIPCVGFGETNLYNTVKAKSGTFLRKMQDRIQERLGYPAFLFYAYGLAPYPKPVYTVVGAPISCEKTVNPSKEQIAELKSRYIEELSRLYRRYKDAYDPQAGELKVT
ncbi:unnamed protein product [Calicophoron daubneyi]|uniref:Acyltransferase n=1 Tax=Calicophoron daubneyi TaxID=300641 RepID=A0AAV2T3K0_CALDB